MVEYPLVCLRHHVDCLRLAVNDKETLGLLRGSPPFQHKVSAAASTAYFVRILFRYNRGLEGRIWVIIFGVFFFKMVET